MDATLELDRKVAVPPGSTRLVACAPYLCVVSQWEHRIVALEDGHAVTINSFAVDNPAVAGLGNALVIEGYERVSLFAIGTDLVSRWLDDGRVTAVGLTDDFKVVLGDGQQLKLLQ